MDRRKALKNIGLGAGFLVATPSVLSILNSCASEPTFTPVFLSQSQGHALRSIVDLIIPSDETIPGAVDVGVHEFIDNFWDKVIPLESQAQVRTAFLGLEKEFQSTFSKDLASGKPEEFDQLLKKYLTPSPEAEKALGEKAGEYYMAFQKDPSAPMPSDVACNQLFQQLRGMTIWGWKNSEPIGETVLAYEPIPGQQVGCLSVSEATGGKTYSL